MSEAGGGFITTETTTTNTKTPLRTVSQNEGVFGQNPFTVDYATNN